MLKTLMIKGTLIAFVCSVSFSAHAVAQSPRPINVPAGELVTALETLSKQAAVELVYQPAQLKSFRTGGVKGTYTPEAAIQILLKGTPLELRTDPSGAMLIAPPRANTTSDNSSTPGSEEAKEGKKSFSDGFLLAQAAPGQATSTASVEKQDEQGSKKKALQLEEVIVTGSRIPQAANGSAQEIKVYTREQIDRSGQTTVFDFLNTLPEVSVSNTNSSLQNFAGATTVQLRGLPVGTTLVLINGHRVEAVGGFFNSFFDLNNIPAPAVERIEILPVGSAAIYGSDAIAGVVNIILKKAEGLAADLNYGHAAGLDDTTAGLTWGRKWARGSVSITGSYLNHGALTGDERSITSDADYRRFGGTDARQTFCSPGNIYSANGSNLPGLTSSFAAIPSGITGTPTTQNFIATAGTLNKCNTRDVEALISPSETSGVVAYGNYQLLPSVELFTEVIFSRYRHEEFVARPVIAKRTLSAQNPFNPFGVDLLVDGVVPGVSNRFSVSTDFLRPLLGARGHFSDSWNWEISAWDARGRLTARQNGLPNRPSILAALASSDPATAYNPFTTGTPVASTQVLQNLLFARLNRDDGSSQAVSAFIRGPLFALPAGPVEAVFGSEYDRDRASNVSPFLPSQTLHRDFYSVFGETRVPILTQHRNAQVGDTLTVTLAARYDRYNDFGNTTNPQYGIEWRPADALLIRGAYAKAFQAPGLFNLYEVQQGFPLDNFVDPLRGNEPISGTGTSGGNPKLQPQTGFSRSLGLVWSSRAVENLQLALTAWHIEENNRLTQLGVDTIIANEASFPGRVVRGTPTPQDIQRGFPGPILSVDATTVNFGTLSVSGVDLDVNYKLTTGFGELLPSLSLAQMYKYQAAIVPGSPMVDRLSKATLRDAWAPRAKGTAAFGWKRGAYSANIAGRYVSSYQDYDPLANGRTQTLGDFWLWDASFRCDFGKLLGNTRPYLNGAYLAVGAVNILNKQPQFSTYLFDLVGYDPYQADIRGRYLHAQLGVHW